MKRSKEDELVSIKYRIEKSGMNQQKLENRLVTISEELKRSKRNSLIFMTFLLLVIAGLVGGVYYLRQDDTLVSNEQENANLEGIDDMQKINDSLLYELNKLKSDITEYRNNLVNENRFSEVSDTIHRGVTTSNALMVSNDSIKKMKLNRRHCYVKQAFRSNGTIFIEVDFIEYYKGKKAVEKAKQNNAAEYDIDKNGDTLYFLYDNYYVSNVNTKLRRLELNEKASIQDLNQIAKGFPLKAFQRIIKDNPIMVLELHDGVVYKIRKQKLP